MTSTPHDPPARPGGGDAPEVVDLGAPGVGNDPGTGGERSRHRRPHSGRRRSLLVGGGLVAALLVGGGVTYAAGSLGGGGASPEQAIPSSAFAVVKVDLDPSAGQKVGALRFLRKFPDARRQLGASDDPRQAMFEALTKDGQLTGSWARDVQPWLGKRGALAVVPGATAEADPVPVVVLAVTDAAKARAGLTKVSKGAARCSVNDDFAVCASDAAAARAAVTAAGKSAIADDKVFTKDVRALGGEGIATAWVDLGRARSAVPALESAMRRFGGGAGVAGSLQAAQLKGRYVTSLRFDGADLELAGRVEGADAPALTGTSGVGQLPAGTIAAAGTAGADQLVATAWKQLRTTMASSGGADQLDQQLEQAQQQLGITIPGDIQAALGKRAVIAFGGMSGGTPQVALRVSGDRSRVAKLVGAVTKAGGQLPLVTASAGTDTVVASDRAYADRVAKSSGLGSDPTFTAAVPRAKDAQQVVYVNVAALVDLLRKQGATVPSAQVGALSAVGLSGGRDGSASTFTLRVTTR